MDENLTVDSAKVEPVHAWELGPTLSLTGEHGGDWEQQGIISR